MSTTTPATATAGQLRHATLAIAAPRPAYVELQMPDGPRRYAIAAVERVGHGLESRLIIRIKELPGEHHG